MFADSIYSILLGIKFNKLLISTQYSKILNIYIFHLTNYNITKSSTYL